jgi:MoxR-like ATPase
MNGTCKELFSAISNTVEGHLLFGHERLIRFFVIAFLARGHVLVEGPPGTGKTLTAKIMAHLLARSFRRVQFTSDMLPSDLIGAHLYNPAQQRFDFIRGPLFADFIIADEVNRTPPRTQSALLEAMEERQVTVEGETLKLGADFFVIATQNPHDFEGTYPLPESQLDRFLFKMVLSHAPQSAEIAILQNLLAGSLPPDLSKLRPVPYDRVQIEQELASVTKDPSIVAYITSILDRTRNHPLLEYGSGIRGGIALARSARVLAALAGRGFVLPDDIKELAVPTLHHRIRVSSDAQLSQQTEATVLQEIVSEVPFPR